MGLTPAWMLILLFSSACCSELKGKPDPGVLSQDPEVEWEKLLENDNNNINEEEEEDPEEAPAAKPRHWNSGPVTKPLHLPEYVIATDADKTALFRPEKGVRPLPESVKQMLLHPKGATSRTKPDQAKRIEVLCHVDRMYVRVKRDLFKSRDAYKRLKLGSCPVNEGTNDHYYLLYLLSSKCGFKKQSNKGCLIISIKLSYNLDAPVLRELPFETTIFCKFPRFFHSYKVGFHPQLRGGTVYRQLQSKSKFVITPQDASGKNIVGSRSYTLGQLMFFQASGPDVSHSGDKRLYINKCYMTASQNPNSSPRYTIIDNQGCMVDGKVSAESKFLKCGTKMVQRFSVAAFIFRGSSTSTTRSQQIYMHCEVTVGSVIPTPSLKACNFDSTAKRWKELHGADSVCACCESTCPSTQAKAPRSFVSTPSWKVGLTSEDETESVTVAPRIKSQEVVPFEMGAGGADHQDFLENWDHDY